MGLDKDNLISKGKRETRSDTKTVTPSQKQTDAHPVPEQQLRRPEKQG